MNIGKANNVNNAGNGNANMRANVCDPGQLEAFLGGDLSEAEEREFTSHLNTCEPCRRALERQAAEPEAWAEAGRLLAPGPFDGLGGTDAPGAVDAEDAPGADTVLEAGAARRRPRQPLAVRAVLEALAPTDDPAMLGRLGGYEIWGVVGCGGMGVVLKAVDRSLDRTVAIKVLAPHLASSGAARRRFAREAKAAAAVLHPNVIAIHSVYNESRDSGGEALPYLVMPFVRGSSLQKRLDAEGPLSLREVLRIGAQVAAGLAAAHAQGLVHRDIKPANILLEEGTERVTLTDFGLARAVDDATITAGGALAGTPQYMSPEQARGEAVDQRSDLFSLGSVLYATCTGRPPFRAEAAYGVMRRITDEEPAPVRGINPDVPEWLCSIVAKLMAKRPADRFASAAEVAELLERCLAHVQQPVAVPLPESLLPHAADRGGPFHVTGKGVIAMTGVIALTLLGVFLLQAPHAAGPEGPQGLNATSGKNGPNQAKEAKEARAVPTREHRFTVEGNVQAVACSADGKRIAVADRDLKPPSDGNGKPKVEVLDAETGKEVVSMKLTTEEEDALLAEIHRTPPFEVLAMAFSPDGSLLAVGTSIGQIKLFDAHTGELVRSLDDAKAKAADKKSPEKLKALARAIGGVASLAFSPDGTLLAVCGDEIGAESLLFDPVERRGLRRFVTGPGRLKVWEVSSGALKHDLVGHSRAGAVAFSPDGKLLASAGRWEDGRDHGSGVILWDPQSGAKVRTVSIPSNGGTYSVAFSPDGRLLALGLINFDKDRDTSSGSVTLAHAGSGIVEWQQSVPRVAKPVVFSPDGRAVIVFCHISIRFLDTQTGELRHELKRDDPSRSGHWNDIAVAARGHTLVAGGLDGERKGSVDVWALGGAGAADKAAPGQEGEK